MRLVKIESGASNWSDNYVARGTDDCGAGIDSLGLIRQGKQNYCTGAMAVSFESDQRERRAGRMTLFSQLCR